MITVYKASAGSGKTYNLVKEYLKLLLGCKNEDGTYSLDRNPDDNHAGILAITFTNKATEEMKRRIIAELDTLGNSAADSPYADELCTVLNTTKPELQTSAKKALGQLLHDYNNFNVSTIDAFFQMILRTFAYEVELSGNYNIELNDEYAIAVGISNLKQELHESGTTEKARALRQWLIEFMKARIDEGKSWDVFRAPAGNTQDTNLYSFARDLSKETVKRNIDKLIEYLDDKSRINDFKSALQKSIALNNDRINKACADFNQITKGLSDDVFSYNFNKKFTGKLTSEQTGKICDKQGKAEKWFKKKHLGSIPYSIIEGIDRCIARIGEAAQAIESCNMILSKLYFLGLLGDISASIIDFTKENNVVMLSDTNEILKKIIGENDTPFVYERVGLRLRHFLIDEFQDTSEMQWENLKPLVRNSLSTGNDNLIIGDVKQSIYRFRNSDPSILKDKIYTTFRKEEITDIGGSLKENTNWRSAKNIVRWNNTCFTLLARKLGMSDIYSNVVQQVAPKNRDKNGHVRFEWIASDKDTGYKDVILDKVVNDIRSMLSRGYKQNDIAILVNRKSEGQSVIEKLLADGRAKADDERINVVSEESLIIRKSPAVKIIIAMLSALDCQSNYGNHNSDDRQKSLALIIKRIQRNISNGRNATEAIAEAIGNDERIDKDTLFGGETPTSIAMTVERIIQTQLSDTLRKSQTPFIQTFQDIVTDFESRYGSDLHQFLKFWESTGKNTTISSPDNIEAVNIMTIHKSKGLEFPCVIIPFCNWDFEQNTQLEWIESDKISITGIPQELFPPIIPVTRSKNPKDTAFKDVFEEMGRDARLDTLNKTYVAFTRAGEEMIAYIPEDKKGDLGTVLEEIAQARQDDIDNAASLYGEEISEELLVPGDFYSGTVLEIGEQTIPQKKDDNKGAERRWMPGYETGGKTGLWKFDVPDMVTERRESPKFKGVMMHRIMCRIKTSDDVDKAIKFFRTKGMITGEEAEEFGKIIRHGISSPEAAEWFAPGNRVISERPMINGKGNVYRPDRIVVTPEGKTIVIDYKFGEKEDSRYLRQVRNYMEIIGSCGFDNPEGYVWYIPENIIRKVSLS